VSAKNEYKGKLLNRWPRAIARLCDLAWQMALVMGLLVYVINKQGQSLALNSVLFYALLFASIPLALLLDAIVAVLLGNTPAKIVIGVRATTSRGERLNPLVHLRRNIGVWTDGIALGFAPLSFLTMVRQFKRVSGRREAKAARKNAQRKLLWNPCFYCGSTVYWYSVADFCRAPRFPVKSGSHTKV